MPRIYNLAMLEQTSTTDQCGVGKVAGIWDATYGSIKAIYIHSEAAITVVMSAMFPNIHHGWNTTYYAECDENYTSLVTGIELCIGAYLGAAVTTAACYSWALISGLNPIAMVTGGGVTAGHAIIPTSTDGTWASVAASDSEDVSGTWYQSQGHKPAVALKDDASTSQAVGTAMFNTMLSGLPVTV